MKTLSFKDLDKVLSKLEKLQQQADKLKRFVEKKIGCSLNDANEQTNFSSELILNMLAIEGSIEGAIENVYNI